MGMKFKVQLPAGFTIEYNWRGAPKKVPVYPEYNIVEDYKEWCKERVGTNGWNYYGQHKKRPCEFRFKREEDLLAFKLRFGL